MKIEDFTLVQNRQKPSLCYCYRFYEGKRKYEIFTMNGGKTFLASIEGLNAAEKWSVEYSDTFTEIEQCLTAFKNN